MWPTIPKVMRLPFLYRLHRLRHPQSLFYSSAATKRKTFEDADSFLSSLSDYQEGKRLHGFTIKQVQEVSEFALTAVSLKHDSTGADYLHIARNDANNVFSVGFRTTPMNSTGVPHILEHTVLCGSEKFPCRDPFFKMLNRSLATYMNALTSCDYTMYPFATQNRKDFQNLMSVYLDAVFNPCLRQMDFSQEGWRLEHKDVNDKSSDIIFKGVVFNEMKGAFANSDNLFVQHLQSALLPDHTYANVSGGDPLCIPDLTWDQLCKFHATHYHPSNARFYTYGDIPLDQHLHQLNDYLQKFTKIMPNTSVPHQRRWTEPRRAQISCRPDPLLPNPEKNTTISVSYLLHDITDVLETMTMQIISELLIDGPNSPFYAKLLTPQMGSCYSPGAGFDGNIKEAVFSIGLQGIKPSDTKKVVSSIDETFKEVLRTGFPPERIEAILHRIELAMKHVTTNFGLFLSMGLMPGWIHDGSPIQALQMNHLIQQLRKNIQEDPEFLQKKIKKYFVENQHRLELVMSPSVNYEEQLVCKEQEKLSVNLGKLTQNDRDEIYEKGLNLAAKQNLEEDISCLPTLQIRDIDPVIKYTEFETVQHDGIPIQVCVQPTNGVTYFRGVLDTSGLSPELKRYLPLFCEVLTELGAGNMDFKQLSQRIELKTGGLGVNTHVVNNPSDIQIYEEGIRLYSHCLDNNVQDMLSLWSEIINGTRFDEHDRLTTLINIHLSNLVSHLPDVGHSYAITHASSTLSTASHLREQYGGIKQIKEIRRLAEMDNAAAIVENLKKIAHEVLNKNKCRFALNATKDSIGTARKHLEEFISNIPKTSESLPLQKSGHLIASKSCYFVLPFPVHYVSKCVPGVSFNHPDHASLRVLARLMTNKYLHREIREKGGAYGGGASHSPSGIFTFYSYRDPNSLQTLETFDNAVQWIQKGEFNEQHVDEAKLSVFQSVDKPRSPGEKGSTHFYDQITCEMIQNHRNSLFNVKKSNLIQAAVRYLVKPEHSGNCILGAENTKCNTNTNWDIITEYKEL